MATRKAVSAPLDPKVVYATGGAAVTALVLWLLGQYAFGGDVPEAVAGVVMFFVPGIVAYLAGYLKTTPLAVLKGRANAAVVTAAATGPTTPDPTPGPPTDMS